MGDLENQFEEAMIQLYKAGKRDCGYDAKAFLGMVFDTGGLSTAKSLLATLEPSSGFDRLWECGRLDITVEAHVLLPEYRTLFTEAELEIARIRLEELGYSRQD